MTRLRFRLATANTAAIRTNENNNDRMKWPPSSSSTNGAETRRMTRATRSCTVEKRRNLSRFNTRFIECLDSVVSFIQCSTVFSATPKVPGRSGGKTLSEFGVSLRLGSQLCSDVRLDLKPSRHRPTHWSPHSFATFPHTPLHRRVPIHLGVLEIFPGKLLFGAELLIGLVLFGSTDVCLIVSRVRKDVIRFLALFHHGH